MFRNIFYGVTAFVVLAQAWTIIGNFIADVHGSTIWMIAPITVTCLGFCAVLKAIDKMIEAINKQKN